jgi:hypothetical protein
MARNNDQSGKPEDGSCLGAFTGLCYTISSRFRDRLIGRTSAFGAEYRGSSPRPGTKIPSAPILCFGMKSHFAIVQQDNTDQRDTQRPNAGHYTARSIFGGQTQL